MVGPTFRDSPRAISAEFSRSFIAESIWCPVDPQQR
jgi:hypothetical protein